MHYGDWLAKNSTISSPVGAWAFRGFLTLSRHRRSGMTGAEAISFTDLQAWLDRERAVGAEREDLEQLIQVADLTFCNLVAAQSKGPSGGSPKPARRRGR